MDLAAAAGAALAAGYLLGSVPFSWIAVKARTGTDLRTVGSGNVGATNASRVLGRAWFPLLFALDAAKGAGAVLLAGALPVAAGDGNAEWVRVAGAGGAVLGHVLPAWLRFRGGKAVAAGAGAILALSPWAALAGLAGFAAAAALWRFVSLGSMAGVACACAAQAWLSRAEPLARRAPVEGLLGLLALAVVILHVPNIRRIAAGTEPRILSGRPGSPGAPEGPADE